ncbi:hypothetical protein BN1723_003724 [Verticillium longisporum]|uniref:VWFA domain-containing protein n=1 Tax=Verticillium longisporum TaxID=100787 RepID=A0A0G4M9K6_VERLO|nr:hypothetical protein BN1723_003724 [Verticillium longisporum]
MTLLRAFARLTTGSSSSRATSNSSATPDSSVADDNMSVTSEPATLAQDEIDDLTLSVHPLASREGLLVKVEPPTTPREALQSGKRSPRAPCDIVLVIDVSGSMHDAAPAPVIPGQKDESTGLSILDLTKHAARTILETLDERDRLGIVTFTTNAKVILSLVEMSPDNKISAKAKIENLQPLHGTNMWHGITEGIKLFSDCDSSSGRVPAMMVLTDGMPNSGCPRLGYIPKLRDMGQLPATIHTFGFGYHIRSGLLKSIAEIGGGNYAFIPDAGMIGTVFVHAVANLQSTFANRATLTLTYPSELAIQESLGDSVEKQAPIELAGSLTPTSQLTISLGNIQYGQSRDIYLCASPDAWSKLLEHDKAPSVKAMLHYSQMTSTTYAESAEGILSDPTTLDAAEIAYHQSRSQMCAFLSTLFPIISDEESQQNGEHQAVSKASDQIPLLHALISRLPARTFTDQKNQSLVQDLSGPEPKGQVSLAITKAEFYRKWGVHYLPSILNAHTRQICNSFKDPGPLQYGAQSPLFIACRKALDDAFDSIPPPTPSRYRVGTYSKPINMRRYHSSSNPCFAGSTPVLLASGRSVPIRQLRHGVKVLTPRGPRRVAVVLVTPVRREVMCRVGGLVVTPWHPLSADAKSWGFPAQMADSAVRYTGCIYSVVLQTDRDPAAHALRVGGHWGVSLGHGVTAGGDFRAHQFFGDYMAVAKSLKQIGIRKGGIVLGGGTRRDEKTGLVNGFRRATMRLPRTAAELASMCKA